MPVHASKSTRNTHSGSAKKSPGPRVAQLAKYTDERPVQAKLQTEQAPRISQLQAYQTMADKKVQNPVSSEAPVQRQIDPRIIIDQTKPSWGIDERFRNKLLSKVKNYNEKESRKDDSKDNVHRNLKLLDQMEHWVYDWFSQNQHDKDNPNRRGLFDLLDDIQKDHQFWVGKNVDAGHTLWTKDTVDAEEQVLIDQVWDHIANGTGAFEILNTISTTYGPTALPVKLAKQFRNEILANLARLYSRPKGRELLKALDGGKADPNTITFVLAPLYKLIGDPKLNPNPYVGAKAKPIGSGAELELKTTRKKGQKKTKLVRGQGTSTGVEVAPNMKDSSMVDFDDQGNHILSPGFVGLGHELIHAAHFKKGTFIGAKPKDESHANIPKHYHDDLEEFVTIASGPERARHKNKSVTATLANTGPDAKSPANKAHTFKLSKFEKLNAGLPTEADIRAEHGLGIRHGHTTSANPLYYPGAQATDEPGKHVKNAEAWLNPHKSTLDPHRFPPPQALPQRAQQGGPVRQLPPQQQQLTATSKMAKYLRAFGITVVVGAAIATTLLWKYGYFDNNEQTS